MRRILLIVAIACGVSHLAAADTSLSVGTEWQELADHDEGYCTTKINADTWVVSFVGKVPFPVVLDMALLRSSDVALENGAASFIVLSRSDLTAGVSTTAVLTIRLVHTAPQNGDVVYEANRIRIAVRQKYFHKP